MLYATGFEPPLGIHKRERAAGGRRRVTMHKLARPDCKTEAERALADRGFVRQPVWWVVPEPKKSSRSSSRVNGL
jgi:hypothetical protein